jgi:hypothetical protein
VVDPDETESDTDFDDPDDSDNQIIRPVAAKKAKKRGKKKAALTEDEAAEKKALRRVYNKANRRATGQKLHGTVQRAWYDNDASGDKRYYVRMKGHCTQRTTKQRLLDIHADIQTNARPFARKCRGPAKGVLPTSQKALPKPATVLLWYKKEGKRGYAYYVQTGKGERRRIPAWSRAVGGPYDGRKFATRSEHPMSAKTADTLAKKEKAKQKKKEKKAKEKEKAKEKKAKEKEKAKEKKEKAKEKKKEKKEKAKEKKKEKAKEKKAAKPKLSKAEVIADFKRGVEIRKAKERKKRAKGKTPLTQRDMTKNGAMRAFSFFG